MRARIAIFDVLTFSTLAWLAVAGTEPARAVEIENLPKIVARVLPSVVRIEVATAAGRTSGTGFLVSEHGLVVTAAHVLEGATAASVALEDRDIYDSVQVVDRDDRRDIAVIRIKGFRLPHLEFADSSIVEPGSRVAVIGNPAPGGRSLDWTVTDGLLSAVRRDGGSQLFQLSVPVTFGSSGSPVIDGSGRVIGMVVSGFRTEEFNFAVPGNYIQGLLHDAREAPPQELASLGLPLNASVASTTTQQVRPAEPGDLLVPEYPSPVTIDIPVAGFASAPPKRDWIVDTVPKFFCNDVTIDFMDLTKKYSRDDRSVELEIQTLLFVRLQEDHKAVSLEYALEDGDRRHLLGRIDGISAEADDRTTVWEKFELPRAVFDEFFAEGREPLLRIGMIVRRD
jgi:S1-C subfamily serine protease